MTRAVCLLVAVQGAVVEGDELAVDAVNLDLVIVTVLQVFDSRFKRGAVLVAERKQRPMSRWE